MKRHGTILAIILVAASIFAIEQMQGESLAMRYGAIPLSIDRAWNALINDGVSGWSLLALCRLFTAIMLHGDIEHLLYNMVFLWTFGALTAQILGPWWALAIFVACGICGNIAQVWLNVESPIPIIGASGAVCGFEGVYLGLALSWRLPWPDVWPLAHPIPPMQLAAFGVVGFVIDMSMLSSHDQQVAYGAHVGGFLSGLAIAGIVASVIPTPAPYR